jgi:chemotaxis protein CheX
MDFVENEISQFTESLWTSLLGLQIARSAADLGGENGMSFLTAYVQITGTWKGTVALKCAVPLANRVAGIMFGLEDNALKSEDINDAVGELVNITGGYIKTMLPGPCQLSLPKIAGSNGSAEDLSGDVICRMSFQHEDKPLLIILSKLSD